MKRKLLSALTSIILLSLSISGITACSCNNDESTNGIMYVLNEDGKTYSVIGAEASLEGNVVIGSKYKGRKITAIQNEAFKNCSFITAINIGENVETIGDSAFYGCSNLSSLYISNGATKTIGNFAFAGTALKRVNIYQGVKSIGDYAFKNCSQLEDATIYEVETVGKGAFENCEKLEGITIYNETTFVGEGAFANCINITYVTIGNGLSVIEKNTFKNCVKLSSLIIGKGVTKICDGAFNNCLDLKVLYLPKSVTQIEPYAFQDCCLETIACEHKTKPNGWNSDWNYMSCPVIWDCNNSNVAEDGCVYRTIEGVRYRLKDGSWQVIKSDTSIITAEIVDKEKYNGSNFFVTSIEEEAFYNCDKLEQVFIPEIITSIGKNAFYGCYSLTRLSLPKNVTYIGDNAFAKCNNLEYNVIGGQKYLGVSSDYLAYLYLASVESSTASIEISNHCKFIGSSAFHGCSQIVKVELPSSVTSIGSKAFSNCAKLNRVIILNKVKSLGDYVFENCPFLEVLVFDGTKEEWNSIEKGVNWKENSSLERIICKDGDIVF